MSVDPQRFAHLTFEDFRALALDASLSRHEKIGFPDAYRAGKTESILADIRSKLTHLDTLGARVLDIGAGCGELALRLIEHGRHLGQSLVLVDSEEVLAQLPDHSFATKVPGRFPEDSHDLLVQCDAFDVILVYSVLHYVFAESDPVGFVESALGLLDHGGEMLVGDIPLERFFTSPAGVRFHRANTGQTDESPDTRTWIQAGAIDDDAILGLVSHARRAGFDAYVVPQGPDLPMANRREDLLFRRP
ncbi:MAG: class I SAM-dependent methyltransferase [Vicinamibacterales bacterium]